jgi:hypothetical protein
VDSVVDFAFLGSQQPLIFTDDTDQDWPRINTKERELEIL